MGRSHSGPTKDSSTKLPRMVPERKMNEGAKATRERAKASALPPLLPISAQDNTKLRGHGPAIADAIVTEFIEKTAQEPVPDEPDPDSINFRGKGPLSLEEKIFILEHRFRDKWQDKRIAKALRRDHRTITEFLNRYRSTSTLARHLFEANAEKFARRVIRKANVDQSMEVLNRLDVLPEKDRKGNQDVTPQFNIIVGNPGQTNVVMPIPDQKAIEAARKSE